MKGKTIPIVITFIIIIIIVSLFTNIKQTEVVCEKKYSFDKDVYLKENIVASLDGKRITHLVVKKTITLPDEYANDIYLNDIKESFNRTLEYLGNNVSYAVTDNKIIVTLDVHKDEIVLLDNIDFEINNDLKMIINSNTKSNEVITLTIGESYTDGEFMQYMKSKGYSCN